MSRDTLAAPGKAQTFLCCCLDVFRAAAIFFFMLSRWGDIFGACARIVLSIYSIMKPSERIMSPTRSRRSRLEMFLYSGELSGN